MKAQPTKTNHAHSPRKVVANCSTSWALYLWSVLSRLLLVISLDNRDLGPIHGTVVRHCTNEECRSNPRTERETIITRHRPRVSLTQFPRNVPQLTHVRDRKQPVLRRGRTITIESTVERFRAHPIPIPLHIDCLFLFLRRLEPAGVPVRCDFRSNVTKNDLRVVPAFQTTIRKTKSSRFWSNFFLKIVGEIDLIRPTGVQHTGFCSEHG